MYDGSVLDRAHYLHYLGQLYFGSAWELPFGRYIDRAYRDFNRTMRGFAKDPHRDQCLEQSRELLSKALTAAAAESSEWSVSLFDDWHSQTCHDLIQAFDANRLSYGQAQKWLNMALKYVYTAQAAGVLEDSIGGLQRCYAFAHMPVDNVVLDGLEALDGPTAPRPWSQLSERDYLDFQEAVRSTYQECPLDVEFMLWRGPGINPTPRGSEA